MTESETSADSPGVIAFPPLIWAMGAAISVLVHFFVIQVPIITGWTGSSLGNDKTFRRSPGPSFAKASARRVEAMMTKR
jgi:hypothetical protein